MVMICQIVITFVCGICAHLCEGTSAHVCEYTGIYRDQQGMSSVFLYGSLPCVYERKPPSIGTTKMTSNKRALLML